MARSWASTRPRHSPPEASACGRCWCSSRGAGERDGQLLSAAVAVELLHMATLVHDDVLDRAPVRRGRATVYAAGRAPGGHRHR